MYQVISTGSTGNAILYHGSILVDCGVPYARIEPCLYNLQIVLLTHIHNDHFRYSTIRKLSDNRPTLRFGCGPWMVEYLDGVRNVDVFEFGQVYDYGAFQISPIRLYHDVPHCGYRIFKDDTKILHATDTSTLEGISAKGYNLYAIESNYDGETIDELIALKEARGEFAYEKGVINSHLSEQQARDFIYRNKGENSQVLRLHETRIAI